VTFSMPPQCHACAKRGDAVIGCAVRIYNFEVWDRRCPREIVEVEPEASGMPTPSEPTSEAEPRPQLVPLPYRPEREAYYRGSSNIALTDLETGVFSPRKHFSPSYVERLTASFKREGQFQPIVVRSHPTKPGKYQLIDGEHRVRALRKAGELLVRAEVVALSDEEAYILAMRLNQTHGKPLDEIEEALRFKEMMEKYSYTQQRVAEVFEVSQPLVSIRLKLVEDSSQELREAFIRRLIKPEAAREIAELPKEEQTQVVGRVAGKKISQRATRALVHSFKAAKTPEEKRLILSKPVEVYAQLYKQPEALQRSLLAQPEQPTYQRFECPCGCGWSLWIQWNERTAKWEH